MLQDMARTAFRPFRALGSAAPCPAITPSAVSSRASGSSAIDVKCWTTAPSHRNAYHSRCCLEEIKALGQPITIWPIRRSEWKVQFAAVQSLERLKHWPVVLR